MKCGGILVVAFLFSAISDGYGQGCVARLSTPVISAFCGRADYNRKWSFTAGYRFQPSSRHFIGTVEQKHREEAHNQIQNMYHLLDFTVVLQLSNRWSANVTVPVVFQYRNQLYPPRGEHRVNSIGDVTFGVQSWIFRPPTEGGGNIGVGVSMKLPTGRYNVTRPSTARDGR